jgi:3-keto-5-aminohexanoate cleavage enzyme
VARKTWLEVALNGGWTRARQPRVPITVAEIVTDGIACVRNGAAIVHVHAYDAETGRQKDDAELYARIIEGIRAEVDAIVYPTFDGTVPAGSQLSRIGAERYAAVEALAARGLLEWSAVDPGTTNFSTYGGIARDRLGTVYVNTEQDVRAGLALATRHGLHPSYAIYEPGFLRLGAALAPRYAGLKTPIYRLMLTEGFTFGFAPRPYALAAYQAMLDEHAPGAPWMVAGLMVDVVPLAADAVARGAHLRVGLEDAPLGTERGNPELVAAAAAAIERTGSGLATASDVRQALTEACTAG